MSGGAWSFLVGGTTYLVNSDNERDTRLLTSLLMSFGRRNNRYAMPLYFQGLTRARLNISAGVLTPNTRRAPNVQIHVAVGTHLPIDNLQRSLS